MKKKIMGFTAHTIFTTPPPKKNPMKHISKVAGVGGERRVMVFDGGSHHTERQISRVVI